MTFRDTHQGVSSLPNRENLPNDPAGSQPENHDAIPPRHPITPIPPRYTPPGAPCITYLWVMPDDFIGPQPNDGEVLPPRGPITPIPPRYTPPGAPCITYLWIMPDDFVLSEPEIIRRSMLQSEPIAESDHLLRHHFSGQPMTLLDSGAFIVYESRNPNLYKIRPDLYIAFDVDVDLVRRRRNYYVYEVGKPPEFALEVASPNTRRRDMYYKRFLYADIGIGEYWRFDSTGGDLYGYPMAGDILVGGAYQPIELTREEDGMLWGYSQALDLCLCAQGPRLLYYDRKTGRYLNSIAEESAAHQQTAAERDAALSEVERLREELRRLQGK